MSRSQPRQPSGPLHPGPGAARPAATAPRRTRSSAGRTGEPILGGQGGDLRGSRRLASGALRRGRHLRSLKCAPGLAAAIAAALLLVGAAAKPIAAADTPVDLELVLAIDVSGSMDMDERQLQRDGYVAAFRDPEV